jgi:hypothetical protein
MIQTPLVIQEGFVLQIQKSREYFFSVILSLVFSVFPTMFAVAGGGMVLEGDVCIINIDFYSAHFTAYQPDSSGNTQFCQDLPDTGVTIFVLDYLHRSLKEVPVDFRIIRDVTGQGEFVKLKHVEEIEDIEQHTVFYQPGVIETDASLQIEYDFKEKGSYIGIVSAGHPSNNNIYTAVFPFEVGRTRLGYWPLLVLIPAIFAYILKRRFDRDSHTRKKKDVFL